MKQNTTMITILIPTKLHERAREQKINMTETCNRALKIMVELREFDILKEKL